MGFSASFRSDAVGFVGGIWLVWDPLVVNLDIVEFGAQFIHAKGVQADGSLFFITAVYASPRATSRVLLWDTLKRLSVNQTAPWAVIDDFNSILSAEDKRGGSPFERRWNKSFIDTVDLCGLSDIPFSGPRFTWSRNGVMSRIDRVLVNHFWANCFPESSVLHLHKLKSDHRPILLRPIHQVYSNNPKPFRFLSAWLSHKSFDFFVKNKWNAGSDLPGALQNLSADLKKWNKATFGNIFRRKEKLLESLVLLEAHAASNPSPANIREEGVVRSNLEMVLWQEEAIWMQKADPSGLLRVIETPNSITSQLLKGEQPIGLEDLKMQMVSGWRMRKGCLPWLWIFSRVSMPRMESLKVC
ncbi:hypothetical protein LINPERHAP2_LOCUS13214 [Linum perenne]